MLVLMASASENQKKLSDVKEMLIRNWCMGTPAGALPVFPTRPALPVIITCVVALPNDSVDECNNGPERPLWEAFHERTVSRSHCISRLPSLASVCDPARCEVKEHGLNRQVV